MAIPTTSQSIASAPSLEAQALPSDPLGGGGGAAKPGEEVLQSKKPLDPSCSTIAVLTAGIALAVLAAVAFTSGVIAWGSEVYVIGPLVVNPGLVILMGALFFAVVAAHTLFYSVERLEEECGEPVAEEGVPAGAI